LAAMLLSRAVLKRLTWESARRIVGDRCPPLGIKSCPVSVVRHTHCCHTVAADGLGFCLPTAARVVRRE